MGLYASLISLRTQVNEACSTVLQFATVGPSMAEHRRAGNSEHRLTGLAFQASRQPLLLAGS